ncbi:hypothetical protein D6821_00695, partial [Candidatus Parcubacteria bacterium]
GFSQYSEYGERGTIYPKLIPSYLEDGCYINPAGGDYRLRSGAPEECSQFSRRCNQEEVGCQMFASADGMKVPARVTAADYCPSQCVGYDAYLQSETYFDSAVVDYFIPSTAKSCQAEAVGCDAFTNLDAIEAGGEEIEYYSQLKRCVKPSDPTASCADFYTWEGSEESGFQLKVFSLSSRGAGRDDEPLVTEDDSLECNETIFNAPPTDPAYNPDCRQFFNRAGGVSYHLFSKIIQCSDNCHPFRRQEKNILSTIDCESECEATFAAGTPERTNCQNSCSTNSCFDPASDGQVSCLYNSAESKSVFCKNGGKWNSQQQGCVYWTIPGEGRKCTAAQKGCREYSGNRGNNMRILTNYSFEGTMQGWQALGGSSVTLSNDALLAGGNSLAISAGAGDREAGVKLGNLLNQSSSYVIKFLIKANNATDLQVSIEGTGGASSFGSISLSGTGEWELYQLNLNKIEHSVGADDILKFSASQDFKIDDVRLTEIVSRYYLIKDSWQMPQAYGVDICNWDIINDVPYTFYSLGCGAYSDADGQTHYLRQFSNLCQESAVGCEIMIDTYNSDSPYEESWPMGAATKVVPADSYIYAVYKEDKLCANNEKGCQRLGKIQKYENENLVSDVYLINNPDQYDSALCYEEVVDCEEWATDGGMQYFKDPKDQMCEWRTPSGTTTLPAGWYKKKVKRCDNNADGEIDPATEIKVCRRDEDCGVAGAQCIEDVNDYPCPTDRYKTFGYGEVGGEIAQPRADASGNYWAGTCPAGQSGCREYIDPLSWHSQNLIFNSEFSQDVDGDGIADGWKESGGNYYQTVKLRRGLYTIGVRGARTITAQIEPVAGTTINNFFALGDNNQLGAATDEISVNGADDELKGKVFFVSGMTTNVKVIVDNATISDDDFVYLRPVVVAYQLKTSVDVASCNGLYDPGNGCILFNERSKDGINFSSLYWDVNATHNEYLNTQLNVVPKAGAGMTANANAVIKVSPDRICDQWLACRTYTKDEAGNTVCYDLGLCDSLDENGKCKGFVLAQPVNQLFPSLSIQDKTGYYKAGYNGTNDVFDEPNDYFNLGVMEEVGEMAIVQNGSFDVYSEDGYPIGWLSELGPGATDKWDLRDWSKDYFVVISDPVEAQKEGIKYPLDGKGFLKLGVNHPAISEFADIVGGKTYFVSAYANTLNLRSGTLKLEVLPYRVEGGTPALRSGGTTLSWPYGKDWSLQVKQFSPDSQSTRLQIRISVESGEGNVYIDKVEVVPVLNSRQDWHTLRSCRLYPDSSALSCEYIDDKGALKKGWYGYCLEHDMYPGNPEACLLWYPIDRIRSDAIYEGAGYRDKYPLYYCTKGSADPSLLPTTRVIYMGMDRYGNSDVEDCWPLFRGSDLGAISKTDWCSWDNFDSSPDPIPNQDNPGYNDDDHSKDCVGWMVKIYKHFSGYPNLRFKYAEVESASGIRNGMDGECEGDGNDHGTSDPSTNRVRIEFTDVAARCVQIHQVVTPLGVNKAYVNRVTTGSEYEATCNTEINQEIITTGASIVSLPEHCYYQNLDQPFGSVLNQGPDYAPERWLPNIYLGAQQKVGAEYYVDSSKNQLRNLFARSYGEWEFQPAGTCSNDDTRQCSRDDCPNGSCKPAPTPVCASVSHNRGAECKMLGDTTPQGAIKTDNSCPENFDCQFVDSVEEYRCVQGATITDYQCCYTDTPPDPGDLPLCRDTGVNICFGGSKDGFLCRQDDCPDGTCIKEPEDQFYDRHDNNLWDVPTAKCSSPGGRGPDDWCGIPPSISEIKVNGSDSTSIWGGGFLRLQFNSQADSQQLPLRRIEIDWGDETETIFTGADLHDRPVTANINPHSFFHLYNYWDLLAKDNTSPAIDCNIDTNGNYCATKARIIIQDNWGWCSGNPANIYDCDNYTESGPIKVYEKSR